MTIDHVELALINYIDASTRARLILSQLRATEIVPLDIQRALCEVMQIDDMHPNALLEQNLSSDQIVTLLREFDFQKFHPEVLIEIELEEGLLPENIILLLTEKTVKVKGEVWRVHKNDAEPFPSAPHAHNYDSGVTLHLGTGQLFDSNRKSVGNIGSKRPKAVRDKLGGITLPPLDP